MCVGRASILATATDTDSAEEIASAFCTEPPIPGLLPKSDLVTASENCPLASLSDREMIPHFSTEKMLCGTLSGPPIPSRKRCSLSRWEVSGKRLCPVAVFEK